MTLKIHFLTGGVLPGSGLGVQGKCFMERTDSGWER